ASAFAQVRDRAFDQVIILGPLHRAISGVGRGPLTSAHAAYETPLGTVPVDRDLLDSLNAALPEPERLVGVRNDPEHSIEIEVPFLQRVLRPGFGILPIMLVDQSARQVDSLSKALIAVLGKVHQRTLLVASSDLSHFYPQNIAKQF